MNELFDLIRSIVASVHSEAKDKVPVYKDFRPGDIRHSHANVDKAKTLLEYDPQYSVRSGLEKAGDWYLNQTADIIGFLHQETGQQSFDCHSKRSG